MKELGAKWLVEMVEYISDNPQFIVNGFIRASISSALDDIQADDVSDDIEADDVSDDTDADNWYDELDFDDLIPIVQSDTEDDVIEIESDNQYQYISFYIR